MATEYKLSYTASEINEKLGKVDLLDNITIEGYERAGKYVDVTNQANKHAGEYMYLFDGVIVGNNDNYSSYYLSVSYGEKYRITGLYSKYIATVYLLDENKAFIGAIPSTEGGSVTISNICDIVIPTNVAYICVDELLKNNFPAKIEKFVESNNLNFALSSEMSIEGYKREKLYVDLTDEAIKHTGKYINSGLGQSINEVAATSYDYLSLPVSEGEQYHIITLQSPNMFGCYFAYANNTVIECYPPKKGEGLAAFEGEFTVPIGATTLYVNQITKYNFNAKIEKIQTSGLSFVRDTNDGSAGITSHLTGKKLACVGDSITEASNPDGGYFQNYAEIVAQRHGMTVYKDGKGGSTMTNISTQRPFCVDRYLNVPSDFDILTIFFGWNDAYYAKDNIGTINSVEDTTFYGAYKKVLDYFITTYPTKKIGLIVPYGNDSVEPCRIAVRELSEMYGVPCLDLADGKQCSLLWGTANAAQEARRAALTYDSTHPNQAGHEYLATMYEAFIQRL